MLQIRRRLDLGQEPLGPDDRREFRTQHLERDLSIVLEIDGEVHGGHAASPQLTLDAVAIGDGGGDALAHSARVVAKRSLIQMRRVKGAG